MKQHGCQKGQILIEVALVLTTLIVLIILHAPKLNTAYRGFYESHRFKTVVIP